MDRRAINAKYRRRMGLVGGIILVGLVLSCRGSGEYSRFASFGPSSSLLVHPQACQMLNSCVHFAACVTAVMRRAQKRHPGYASGERAMVTQFLLSMYILLVVSCLLSDIPFLFLLSQLNSTGKLAGPISRQRTNLSRK